MKKLVLFFAFMLLISMMAEAGQVHNPSFMGVPTNVTITGSSAITSTPTSINGATLNRTSCVITNSNTAFNVYVTFASTTYTAKGLIDANICLIIPPGGSQTIPGANYEGGPWEDSWIYGKTMYGYVSPTPLTVNVGFTAEKHYNTPAD